MGHIIMPASAFRASLSEDAGVRSGFALTEAEMLEHLVDDHPLRAGLTKNDPLRIGSDVYADTVGDLLFALGAADEPGMPVLSQRLIKLLDKDWRKLFSLDQMLTLEAIASEYMRLKSQGHPEQAKVYEELEDFVGSVASVVMEPLQKAMDIHLAQSPYFTRHVNGEKLTNLADLFRSEKLPFEKRQFFDQRFINYLASRPEKLSEMHWRQFEGLAAEWFAREGYAVELGPGRNDGSIDLRLWRGAKEDGAPPAVIVQCKRQERKIERVVVKALYADILDEKAAAGFIVTTSDISPGAAQDVKARGYPITTANRQQVETWITAMRKPSAGIVMD